MDAAIKPIITAALGFISLCIGVSLWLEAAEPHFARNPGGGVGPNYERLHALTAIASAFLWLGVVVLVLSAAAWLFSARVPSSKHSSAAEPVA